VVRDLPALAPDGATWPHSFALEDVVLAAPATGEVLIEVVCAGLCHSDLSVINGDRPRGLPLVLGHEASGIVREVGAGVERLEPGDRVVLAFVPSCGRCRECVSGREALCSVGAKANRDGTLVGGNRPFADAEGRALNHHLGVSGFSRWTVVSQNSVVRVESEVAFDTLALLGCAVLTGAGAVIHTAALRPGQSIAVLGCGGVGLAVILAARGVGAGRIIAVDPVAARREWALSLGAEVALDPGDAIVDDLRDCSGGGVDVAFEVAGRADSWRTGYEAIVRGGKLVAIGLAHPREAVSINLAGLVGDEKAVLGCYMGSTNPQRDVPMLLAMYESGRLPLDALKGESFQLGEMREAVDALCAGGVGRQMIDLAPTGA
jgi:alcohol dehydrogenase